MHNSVVDDDEDNEVVLWLCGSIQAQQPLGVSAVKLEMCAPSVRENTDNQERSCVRYVCSIIPADVFIYLYFSCFG